MNSTKIFRILFALWGEQIFGVDLIWQYESKFKALISDFQNKKKVKKNKNKNNKTKQVIHPYFPPVLQLCTVAAS